MYVNEKLTTSAPDIAPSNIIWFGSVEAEFVKFILAKLLVIFLEPTKI